MKTLGQIAFDEMFPDQPKDYVTFDEKTRDYWERAATAVMQAGLERISNALDIALQFGQIDGSHHKAWVIDQMVQMLTGPAYEKWVQDACNGEDGPDTYTWDTGATP